MHVAIELVALVIIVGLVAWSAERIGGSPPLLLVVVGVVVSFIPGVPEFEINSDVVLIGLLPPLVYSAAIRTSLVDFRTNRRAILLLSVGAVAFTVVAVGLVAWWIAPIASLAAAFAIGAVVAPPDAVAASAVARRVGMPRRMVAILEGESLVNDATALVALNVAIAALHRHITVGEVAWRFVLAAAGGLLLGLLAGFVLGKVRQQITNPVLDTTLSFVAPWIAFIPAQELHASGVLAVVVAGLYLGQRSPVVQTAASRIAEQTNWKTVAFLLENTVFLLIGLQLRRLIDAIRDTNLTAWQIIGTCVAILLATVVARIVWVYGSLLVYRFGTRSMREQAWGWNESAVVSWAGMRGVVTLAAAFVLPADTPQRALLQLAAFVVVGGTLLVQGGTLPWLVRQMHLVGPNAAEDALQQATLRNAATAAGLERLERARLPADPVEVIDQLRERADARANLLWERLGPSQDELATPYAVYRRLRLQMLDAERATVIEARDAGGYDHEVLRTALRTIDFEEAMLDRIDDAEARLDEELTAPTQILSDCEHLRDAPRVLTPLTPGVCGDCVREGTTWVHLRMCLTCGNVGCCDSSVRRHATGHFHQTKHPVMRSVEPGEAWRWCYVDEQLG